MESILADLTRKQKKRSSQIFLVDIKINIYMYDASTSGEQHEP